MSLRRNLAYALPFQLGALAALVGCGGGGVLPVQQPDRSVVVLFTSDEHSHLFGFSPELDDHAAAKAEGMGELVGGVARRATVLGKERSEAAAAQKDTITVS